MGVKLVIWMDDRWRNLKELAAEGRSLRFAVLRNGFIKMLTHPPKFSNVVAGELLRYRNIKRHKKFPDKNESVRYVNQIPSREEFVNENIRYTSNRMGEKMFARNKKENITKQINQTSSKKEKLGNEREKLNVNNNRILCDEEKSERNIEAKNNGVPTRNYCNTDKKISQVLKKNNMPTYVDSSVESVSSSSSVELVIEINDADVLLMRRFFLKTSIYKVDLDRFDKDKIYRLTTLYKFHPVVKVARLLPQLHHQLTPSLRSNSRTSFQKKTARTTAKSSDKVSKPPRRRSPVKFRKSSVPLGREYSSLEDHAIVSWLSASRERERAVNGNRVWQEYQSHHTRLTGQERSWHSLRNRYLRYILPALGQLALSPSHAQRLRAAAATGEIKKRKKSRPSIAHEPPVRAATARPRLRASFTLSDESDGILHQNVRRPSIQVKNPQAEKSKSDSRKPTQASSSRRSPFRTTERRSRSLTKRFIQANKEKESRDSTSDGVQSRRSRGSLPKTKNSPLPLKSTDKKSENSRKWKENEPDEVKVSSPVPPKRQLGSRSPLKRIQMEKPKNWSEHSDTDGENHERSRLRPRPNIYDDNSDDDNTYTPSSPVKKRRKLFNL